MLISRTKPTQFCRRWVQRPTRNPYQQDEIFQELFSVNIGNFIEVFVHLNLWTWTRKKTRGKTTFEFTKQIKFVLARWQRCMRLFWNSMHGKNCENPSIFQTKKTLSFAKPYPLDEEKNGCIKVAKCQLANCRIMFFVGEKWESTRHRIQWLTHRSAWSIFGFNCCETWISWILLYYFLTRIAWCFTWAIHFDSSKFRRQSN